MNLRPIGTDMGYMGEKFQVGHTSSTK